MTKGPPSATPNLSLATKGWQSKTEQQCDYLQLVILSN